MATVDQSSEGVELFAARMGGGTHRLLVHTDPSTIVPITAGWDAEPCVLEWFGTGRADLLVSFGGGSAGRFARIHRPIESLEATALVFDEGAEVPDLRGLRFLTPIPNSLPTRFDLVALASEGLVLLRNEGTREAPSFPRREPLGIRADLGIGPGRIAQIVADDWDGDGRIDLLIGFDDMEGYWPEGERVPEGHWAGFNQLGGHPGYDQKGRWRGRMPRGRLFWMRNVGDDSGTRFDPPEEIQPESNTIQLGLHPAPLIVSWGGGQTSEVLLIDPRGQVHLHRNFGGQRPPVLMESRPVRVDGKPLTLPEDRTTVTFADLDGDGRGELIYGRADGRVFAVHAGTARDTARTPQALRHQRRTVSLGGHAVVSAADLDADGDVDLIAGDASGRIWLVEDQGSGADHHYAAPMELDAQGVPFRLEPGPDGMLEGPVARPLGYACPTIVDWKDNGRPDLLISGAGGEILFLRNNGGPREPRFDRPEPILSRGVPILTPPRVRAGAACWVSSGPPDLIALDLQGFLCVYPRVDTLEVGPPRPIVDRLGRLIRLDGAFGLGGRCAIWAGPWTGAERTDLLIGLPWSSRFLVPAILGVAEEDLDRVSTVLLLENLGDGVVTPRAVRFADGSPLIVGSDGCNPCGVDWRRNGELDLLVGSSEGEVHVFHREELSWS